MINRADAIGEAEDVIFVQGAREHNLKNLSLGIPRGKFVVITGVSGSGKSTLAFDLLFAEGQRRFLDAMNAYARQFIEQLARPDVDLISGLPPTVSIEQRNSRGGGKSTVATVTEIYHFLRLLFARLGVQYCPECQIPVEARTADQLGEHLRWLSAKSGPLLLLAPVVKNRKGFHTDVAEWAAKHGYAEVRADGKVVPTAERLRLDRFREHDVEVVVGRLEKGRASKNGAKTPQQLIDEALKLGQGTLFTLDSGGKVAVHSTARVCPNCARSFEALDPKMFSYNSSQGWCPDCRGFGETFYLPDVERGARADAIEESWFDWQEGKRELCSQCGGTRLNEVSRAVRLALESTKDRPTIDTFARYSAAEALEYFKKLKVKGRERQIMRDILPEIRERLRFLNEVGLDYLQLGRGVPTLSGGESQRIRLAAQLGSNLTGVLYILDEPTIGLHARDNEHLLRALNLLKNRGNSLVVVEHDEETMRSADHIIDLGPGAGIHGGTLVAAGTMAELKDHPTSLTGLWLRQKRTFPNRGKRRPVTLRSGTIAAPHLRFEGAKINNLKNISVAIPLNRLVVVTGVSGSGKSSLVKECLFPTLKRAVAGEGQGSPGLRVRGWEPLKAVYEVDQAPIGRTPRSTPATYVGFFDAIRQLFAQTPEARLRGYSPSRFSFNSKLGRCPECEGAGTIKMEMNFLPPAYVTCETCRGRRFNRETLEIEHRDKNIAQVLELSVAEALDFFQPVPKIRRPLEALRDTGLDYLKLGQISPTLSGGEAQRLKLVTHLLTGFKAIPDLFNPVARQNFFILEEPTIGLHMADVKRLVDVLQRLVDVGHSVLVIEHNLDLVAEADWVIDLGPEGGDAGGEVIAQGTPEQIARIKRSHTGRFLNSFFEHVRAL